MVHALHVKNLTVSYDKQPVLEDVSLTIPSGVLCAVVGPNGAGKSTFIQAVLNLIPKSSGEVTIFNRPYLAKDRVVGYVPQRGSVDWDFPTNVLDVTLMGRYGHIGWFRRPSKADKSLALEALKKVGMESFADRQISQLSGGQQQRVFLARALVQDAEIYFMDEPFVGVDAATEKAIIALLRELKTRGKTVIVVHHDLHTVPEYFEYTVLLNKEVKAVGRTEEVFTIDTLQETYGGTLAFLQKTSSSVKG